MITESRAVISTVVACVLLLVFYLAGAGCESFKPQPEPEPEEQPEEQPEEAESHREVPETVDVSGAWSLEFRTSGGVYPLGEDVGGLGMTIIQTGDEIVGNWTFGDADGDAGPGGKVDLKLDAPLYRGVFFFRLKGQVWGSGKRISGKWKSPFPAPKDEGTWTAERE